MRIFSSMLEAVKEVERDLWEMGHKISTKSVQDLRGDYQSKEIVGYSFTLLDGKDWTATFQSMGFLDPGSCVAYVQKEFFERTHVSNIYNPGSAWKERREIWEKFLHDGKFSYTYPERLHEDINQWVQLEKVHTFDSQSRQLILGIYDYILDGARRGGNKRVPCTMYYQFLERGDYLYLIHNMRSCDLYTHFPIDLSLTWKMCEGMAQAWKKIPRVIMQIGSLHAFKESMEKRGIF